MLRAATVDQLLVGLELVAAGAVPAGVDALVDVAGRLRAAHHLDRCGRVVRIGGADEPIEADAEALEGRLPGGGPRIDQVVRVDASLARVALHVGGVLVQAGQEARLPAEQSLVAGDGVGADRLEHRVQRGSLARVEDRGGQVEAVAHRGVLSARGPSASRAPCAPARARSHARWRSPRPRSPSRGCRTGTSSCSRR